MVNPDVKKRWVGIYTALPLMILTSMAIIASTSKACISDPAEYTKNPNIHPIMSMTAIT